MLSYYTRIRLVQTDIFTRPEAPEGSGLLWRFTLVLIGDGAGASM